MVDRSLCTAEGNCYWNVFVLPPAGSSDCARYIGTFEGGALEPLAATGDENMATCAATGTYTGDGCCCSRTGSCAAVTGSSTRCCASAPVTTHWNARTRSTSSGRSGRAMTNSVKIGSGLSDTGRNKTVVTAISKISDRPVAKEACLVVIYGLELGKKFNLNRPQIIIGRSSQGRHPDRPGSGLAQPLQDHQHRQRDHAPRHGVDQRHLRQRRDDRRVRAARRRLHQGRPLHLQVPVAATTSRTRTTRRSTG